jgi:CubicO group peptidase (beta-lactamase class C family)
MLTAVVSGGKLRAASPDARPVPWWSFTKTVLAAAALMLVARGRLSLDAEIPARGYTLRQLLQHTAGVPNYGGLAAYHEAVARGDAPWSEAELIRRAGADDLLFRPGDGWMYSNIGYLHVRRIVEAATGDDLQTALHRLIFSPLGLDSVSVPQTQADLDRTAWGNAARYHPGWVYHGLLIGTPADAAMLLHRLMGGALLPDELLMEMRAPRLLEWARVDGRPWRMPGYGLGLMIDGDSPAGRAMGHTGGGPGSTAAVYHFPDRDPPVTTAAFATTEDQGLVEHEAVALAAGTG